MVVITETIVRKWLNIVKPLVTIFLEEFFRAGELDIIRSLAFKVASIFTRMNSVTVELTIDIYLENMVLGIRTSEASCDFDSCHLLGFRLLFVVRYATIISANQLSIKTQTIEESEINKKNKRKFFGTVFAIDPSRKPLRCIYLRQKSPHARTLSLYPV